MVRTPRFAFFTDQRGVVYCEQVDHRLVVMSTLGHTMGGQPTRYTSLLRWEGDEDKFHKDGRDLAERGFVIERDRAYTTPNIWGEVKVIKEVTDLNAGKKLRKICREGTPEAEALFGDQTNLSVPDLESIVDRSLVVQRARPIQPFTSFVLSKIAGQSFDYRAFAQQYTGHLTEAEDDYLLRRLAKG